MQDSGSRWTRINVLFALLLLVTGVASPIVSAQDPPAPATINFVAAAFICESDPGDVSFAAGNVPPTCTPTPGVWFSASTEAGPVEPGCSTDGTGTCLLVVSVDTMVTVTQDTTTTSLAGTVPKLNPITTSASTGATFINLPLAPPPGEAEPTVEQNEITLSPTVEPTIESTEVLPTPTEEPTDEPITVSSQNLDNQSNQLIEDPTATLVPPPTATLTPSPTATTAPSPTATGALPQTANTVPSPTATAAPTATVAITPTPKPVTTTYATVSNTGGADLRCRTAPNTSATIITLLPAGTRVEARGAVSNGWLPVRCAAQDGWISATYMTLSSSTTSPTPTPTTGTTGYGTVSNTGGAGLNCRTRPSTTATIITILPAGSRVETRGAVSNGWVPVRCGGQSGWVSATYITLSTSSGNPTPTPTPTTGTTTYWTVSNTGGAGLNCRTQPSTTGTIITILPAGTRVEARGAVSNGWLPVRCGGQSGWVSASYVVLSSTSGNPTPPPPTSPPPSGATVATVTGTGGGGLRCRTAPVSGATITILPELTRVEVVSAQQSGWVQVRCAGQVGWASVAYLVFSVGSGTGTGAVWIDVNLSRQYMIVYQGSNVLGQTYVSTGRYGFDTPTGNYYINRKIPLEDMTGTIGGEYYYVRDVPWAMYFTNRGHAIHGAYWHNNFGYRMSHGCVNLPVGFAAWLYSITPIGTRVYIHY